MERLERSCQDASTRAEQDDWIEVQRLSEFVAESSSLTGYDEIAELAHRVGQLTQRDSTRPQALEGLVRLIGMCGRIRLADEVPEPSPAKPRR